MRRVGWLTLHGKQSVAILALRHHVDALHAADLGFEGHVASRVYQLLPIGEGIRTELFQLVNPLIEQQMVGIGFLREQWHLFRLLQRRLRLAAHHAIVLQAMRTLECLDRVAGALAIGTVGLEFVAACVLVTQLLQGLLQCAHFCATRIFAQDTRRLSGGVCLAGLVLGCWARLLLVLAALLQQVARLRQRVARIQLDAPGVLALKVGIQRTELNTLAATGLADLSWPSLDSRTTIVMWSMPL